MESTPNLRGEELRNRTKKFALDVIALVEILPKTRVADVLGRQLLRSATSVSANYRAACRAKSKRDFIAKMGIVEEEADECILWLELLTESGVISLELTQKLVQESKQLVAITVASIKTARGGSR